LHLAFRDIGTQKGQPLRSGTTLSITYRHPIHMIWQDINLDGRSIPHWT
jgi:hypothetical protein